MKPIFNKTEKIEFAIKFWSKNLNVYTICFLTLCLSVWLASFGFWMDLIRIFAASSMFLEIIESYIEKSFWVEQLKNNMSDEFFNLEDITDDDIKKE